MASTYYDWHLARSQNRMEQKHLFDNGVRVEKYHHKEGLVLNFLSVVSGKQLTVLLDKQHALEVRNQVLEIFPTDEVTRLRIAMTAIKHHAKQLGTVWGIENHMELIEAIINTANSWEDIKEQAVDAAAQATKIADLEQKVKDLQDAAHQLRGIEGWIEDKDMKRHCTKTLDKMLK